MATDPVAQLTATVRADLRDALSSRDRARATSLREILAVVDNASAVDAPQGYDYSGVVPTDVPRREVTIADVTATMQRRVDEQMEAAATYRDLSHLDRAEDHANGAAVIASHLPKER